jgi:hypothetical protein
MLNVAQYQVLELDFESERTYRVPFGEVVLDLVISGPDGGKRRLPAFWAGGNRWCARFSSGLAGVHRFRTICSDGDNPALHDIHGEIKVADVHEACHSRYQHGAIEVAPGGRYFQHLDGTPFFWLGDTWWMGFCSRIAWPEDFQALTLDRQRKGFTVVQIVMGLYPDMPPFDPRGANEGGFPWMDDTYACINPDYFTYVDRRVQWLAEHGIVPCIVGFWGYYLDFMGLEKCKQFWRYIVARYGAFPTCWCLAGEAMMPYYLAPEFQPPDAWFEKGKAKLAQWSELAAYVQALDPYDRPITLHPTFEKQARTQLDQPELLDFDMTQAGATQNFFPGIIRVLREGLAMQPPRPTFTGEACYEGIGGTSHEDTQRLCFWGCILSGAKAHTYGANGLWQANNPQFPHGASPWGVVYGGPAVLEAAALLGSAQLGLGRKLLERYPWWELEPHQEWLDYGALCAVYSADAAPYYVPYAAGIPGELRIVYFSTPWQMAHLKGVKGFEPGVAYRGFFFDPRTGHETDLGNIAPDETGYWPVPLPPVLQDFVIVFEAIH